MLWQVSYTICRAVVAEMSQLYGFLWPWAYRNAGQIFHVLGVSGFAVARPGGRVVFQFVFTSSVLEL